MSTPQEIIAQLKRTEQAQNSFQPSHPRPPGVPRDAIFLFSGTFTNPHYLNDGLSIYDIYSLYGMHFASRKHSVENFSTWAGSIDMAVPYLEILAEIDKR